jgi:cell division protein FtsW
MMNNRAEILRNRVAALMQGDRIIWLVIAMLAIFSVLTVYSSADVLAQRNNTYTESFLVRHVVLMMGAVVVMYIAHMVNYMQYARWSTVLIAIAIPMLIYTMFFGVNINGASRWIRLPFVGITFQTSDFAKLAIILYVSRTVAIMQTKKLSQLELLGPVLATVILIAPFDLSNALVLFLTCVMQMFIGKVELRNVFSLIMLGAGLFAMLIIMSEIFPAIRIDTWISRLKVFFEGGSPEDTFQLLQAKMAVAKGGFFGVGPGNGVQSYFLPHAYSDYIYCIIIEEYGMIGGALVLMLYMMLVIRTIRMVNKSPKAFGSMLAMGLTLSITIQAFAHMAVNVNLMPVTGLTLPFVSLGGTSLMFTGISLGIILSVSRQIENSSEKEKRVEANEDKKENKPKTEEKQIDQV